MKARRIQQSLDALHIPYPPAAGAAVRGMLVGVVLCAGCAPGSFYWPGGFDHLNTALVRFIHDGDLHRADIFLSNGRFTCDLPDLADPASEARRIEEILVAACREGASHVNLTLWREGGGGWTGHFPGLTGAGATDLTGPGRRLSQGSWFAVDEAFLAGWGEVDRTYAIESSSDLELGDGGFVDVRRHGARLSGSFGFPEGVGGDFNAHVCEGTASLFQQLTPSPRYKCP